MHGDTVREQHDLWTYPPNSVDDEIVAFFPSTQHQLQLSRTDSDSSRAVEAHQSHTSLHYCSKGRHPSRYKSDFICCSAIVLLRVFFLSATLTILLHTLLFYMSQCPVSTASCLSSYAMKIEIDCFIWQCDEYVVHGRRLCVVLPDRTKITGCNLYQRYYCFDRKIESQLFRCKQYAKKIKSYIYHSPRF